MRLVQAIVISKQFTKLNITRTAGQESLNIKSGPLNDV